MSEKKKIAIVGAGPTGLFCAYKLATSADGDFEISIFEKGNSVEKRKCPSVEKKIPCQKCKVCNIMEGEGGCGSFSDGKFPITNDFGGNLWELIGKEKSTRLQWEVDEINHRLYLQTKDGFNPYKIEQAVKGRVEGDDFPKIYSSTGSVYKKICTQHGLRLLDAEIRHLGTDIGSIIYGRLVKYLKDLGVKFYPNTQVLNVYKSNFHKNQFNLDVDEPTIAYNADYVVIAGGRSGSGWVREICKNLEIPTKANKVDIGIRFECPNEIWDHITKDLYESKIIYRTKTYEDLVRTFCMNPSGAVVTENTDGGITVNGHSFEDPEKKTNNTNFALLVSKSFTEPFDDSNEYGKAIVKLSNMLGGGVMVQRYGDLIRGKRSTKQRIKENSVIPTLNAEPGDLSLVLPKRILDDILEMIQKLDHLVPGMINDDNLLYGVEIKQYNSTVDIGCEFENPKVKNLFFGGDGSGWTHSLSQASAMGLAIGEVIERRLKND